MADLVEKGRAAAIKEVGATRRRLTGGTIAFVPSDALIADAAVNAYLTAIAAMSEAGGEGWQTPEGWRLVPVEVTREMMNAAGRYADHCAVHNYGGSADTEGLWDAMLEASPAPPLTVPAHPPSGREG